MKSAYWPLFSSTCLHAFLHTKQSADIHSRNILKKKKGQELLAAGLLLLYGTLNYCFS